MNLTILANVYNITTQHIVEIVRESEPKAT